MNTLPLILASASPRRVELLKQLKDEFQVVPSKAEELHHEQLTARELAQINAYCKARSIARKFPDALVLGADTLVCLGGRLFGKPADLDQARWMLEQLQGQTHQVVTGVCLMELRRRQQRVFAESTDVSFKPLTPAEINRYLAAVNPLDKAGAYAIQQDGDTLVQCISGSYSNVVGLPIERLREELAAWGAPGC